MRNKKKHISPHDRYIRSVLTNPPVIQEFFQHHLPEKIKQSIDFSSIVPQKESFVDDRLRLQITDLLYAVNFNEQPGYLYVLLEHASTPDKFLPFRMLKYTTAIMNEHLRKTGDKILPIVYPLILYTGKKSYNHSTNIYDLFGNQKKLAQNIYTKPYDLVDLTTVSDETLKAYEWFGVAGMITKHIHDPDILPILRNMVEFLNKLEESGNEEYVSITLSYIVEAGTVNSKDEFVEILKTGLSYQEEKIMTLAEQFRQEGVQKGIAQGIEKGIEKGARKTATNIALKMIKAGINLQEIQEMTDLPIQKLNKLHAGSLA